jgi:hypothetical protein
MIGRLLRLFKEFRELEEDLERKAALTDSLERYIEALEGRDKMRVEKIEELEARNREAFNVIRDMRTRLAGLCPDHGEEKP